PITVNVNPGTYNEQLLLGSIGGTSATNTITINGGGATLSYISTNTNQRGVITLDGTDYITVNNLNIQSTSSATTDYCWGVFMTNNADNNTVSNCNISLSTSTTSTNHAGIVISGSATSATTAGSNCDNITISNNTIEGGYYGITVVGNTATGVVSNNQITGNTVKNFYLYGMYVSGTDNTLIESNDIHRMTRTTVSTFAPIYCPTFHSNLKVRRNKIHDAATAAPTTSFTAYGVYLASSTPTVGNENEISNNVIYNMGGEGSHYGLYNSSSGNTRYYYNSISMQTTGVSGTGTTYGFYQVTIQPGIELRNNNIAISRTTTGNHVGIYASSGVTGFSSNYNNVYVNAPAANSFGYATSLQATLAAWQGATSQDAQSQNMDPIYAGVSSGNLTPTNSLLDNLGTPVSVTTDFNGLTRSSTTPDIGAYEFSVQGCTGTPTAGTASAVMTSVCSGSNVSLSLSGFSIGSGIGIQWESSPTGAASWTPIAGATATSLSTLLSGPTDYRAVITCINGGGQDFSNTVSVSVNPYYLCYCSPLTGVALHTTTGNYITNVNIAGTPLNVTTTAVGAGAYTQNYPLTATNTATLTQGQSYTLNASIASASYTTELWIDWDQNGSFDASEYQTLSLSTASSATILVPFTAVPGITGMRLRNAASTTTTFGASGACSNITIGRETEDYIITIAAALPCAGTPVSPGTISANTTNICNTGDVVLTLSGYPSDLGITYQWESSAAGQSNFTPISG
ncbi:MAG: hypothetical protein EOP49_20375, partial [Sphingobacteriales bacterium]